MKTHTYTWKKWDGSGIITHKIKLPKGRWLLPEERVQPTDVICWSDAKFEIVSESQFLHAPKAGEVASFHKFVYRLEQVTQYRHLKTSDTIKTGDQISLGAGKWKTINPASIYQGTRPYSWEAQQHKFRRRLHSKRPLRTAR
jgi:hypothetical protein